MSKSNILWKLYYWFIVIIFLGVLTILFIDYDEIFKGNLFSLTYELFMMFFGLVSILGLRGFIYEKKYFSKEFWIFIFSVSIIDIVGNIIYDFNSLLSLVSIDNLMYLLVIIILLPWYYAFYMYVFKMNKIWSNNND